MSKKEKDVELIPQPPSGWKVNHGIKEGTAPGNYPKIEFDPGSGPHLVVFKIPPGSPGTFNANDPMWVQPGTTSPTVQGMDPQIADWQIFDGGKTLVLLDLNSQAGELSYRVQADGYAPVLDPIIKNGGGGTTSPPAPPPPSYSFAEIGAVAAIIVVVLALGFWMGRRF